MPVSAQPTGRLPCSARNEPIRPMNQPCSDRASGSPSAAARARAAGLVSHSVVGHSSPPMWMYGDGKTSMTSSSTVRQKSKTSSWTPNTVSQTPQRVHTSSRRAGSFPSSGWAASAARTWPGISISGTTRTPRAAAYRTRSRSSCRVYAPECGIPSKDSSPRPGGPDIDCLR